MAEHNKIPDHPFGTPEGVREVGLNPEQIHTCSRPEKGKNPGCRAFRHCEEGVDRKPCYLGMEKLIPRPDGGFDVRREIVHCHVAYAEKHQAQFNGVYNPQDPDGEEIIPQIVRIVAREGEKIMLTESAVTFDARNNRVSEIKEVEKVIPRHPLPRELPQFRNSISANEAIRRLKADRENESVDRMIGHGEARERDESPAAVGTGDSTGSGGNKRGR